MLKEKLSAKDWLINNILEYSTKEILLKNCCKRLKITEKTAIYTFNKMIKEQKKILLEITDVIKRIKFALFILDKKLIRGIDLRVELKIGERTWLRIKRHSDLSDCKITLKGNELWGKPSTIKILKKQIDLY